MSSLPSLLLLSRDTVRKTLSPDDYLDAAETAFRLLGGGRARLPYPMHLESGDGGLHVKAAAISLERSYAAIKVNSNYPGNPSGFGLPTIQGAILLLDGERGSPLALIDSIEVTTRRTAAASALAARYLAAPDSATITVCGCGDQGAAQLLSLAQVLPIRRGYAWDQDRDRAAVFAIQWSSALGIDLAPAQELAAAARQSDVIVTCTTASEPFLRTEMVRPGTFIAAVGADSPAKNEIEPALLARSVVYADVREQALTMGDTHHAVAGGFMAADDIAGELGDLVIGSAAGRSNNEPIFIFDSTGVAVQDATAAALAYERAVASGAGLTVQLA